MTSPPPDGPPAGSSAGGQDPFWTVFEASPTAMLLADDRRRCVDANGAACRLLGLSREELLIRRIDDLTPPEARPGVPDQWSAFLREGSQAACSELVVADGTRIEVEYSASAAVLPGRHLWMLTTSSGARRRPPAEYRSLPHDAPAAASAPPAYGGALSRREREVLGLLAMGASGPEIAERLFISPATVRTHIGNAITKLGAKTRTQAIALALQQRAITLEPDVPAGPPPAEAT